MKSSLLPTRSLQLPKIHQYMNPETRGKKYHFQYVVREIHKGSELSGYLYAVVGSPAFVPDSISQRPNCHWTIANEF